MANKRKADTNVPFVKRRKTNQEILEEKLSLLMKKTIDIATLEFIEKLDELETMYYLNKVETLLESTDNKEGQSTVFKILNNMAPERSTIHALSRYKDSLSCSNGEKARYWVEQFLKIPFGKYSEFHKNTGKEWLSYSKTILDELIYGNVEVKETILEYVAKQISNPLSTHNVICLVGKPGVGKTTVIKALSQILSRPIYNIALGGAHRSDILLGHEYTYIGSTYGKIVDGLISSGVMNPIFAFDELDKVAKHSELSEIQSVLTQLIDPSQHGFNDLYFDQVEFNLQHCVFIFTLNDITKVDPILLDRMLVINMNSYKYDEAFEITKKFVIPKTLKNYNLTNKITISDQIIHKILKTIISDETGIRIIEHTFGKLIGKLNFKIINENLSSYTITEKDVDKLVIIKEKKENYLMYT